MIYYQKYLSSLAILVIGTSFQIQAQIVDSSEYHKKMEWFQAAKLGILSTGAFSR